MEKALQFNVMYNKHPEYNFMDIMHAAFQTYLQYFNCIAKDDSANKLPDTLYTMAKDIKHADNNLLKVSTFVPSDLYIMMWCLSYYYHFASVDLKYNSNVHSEFNNHCIICAKKNSVTAMHRLCDYLKSNHMNQMAYYISQGLKDAPLSKDMLQNLTVRMDAKNIDGDN